MPQVNCKICEKEFYIKPSHHLRGWGKYCSIKCRSKAQYLGKSVYCSTCNKKIYRSPKLIERSKSGKYFCSKSCQTIWRNNEYIGEKNSNWKNGQRAYRNILIRSGRKQICVLCGVVDERVIIAHHVDHKRSNNTLDNLIWLCLNCHFLVHHDKVLDTRIRTL